MMKISHILALIISVFMLTATSYAAPETATNNDEDKSWFLSFIEDKISAPNRQIHISNIQGALSSEAVIGSITIGDNNGIWLKITNAKMDWNRLDLLRGRVSINALSAERIEFIRKPLPSTAAPSPEASGGFAIPELPVSISLKTLDVKTMAFGPDLFGLQSQVSLKGDLSLADGNLDTTLAIRRLDAPGNINLLAKISNKKRIANIDISGSEPKNGIVANILKLDNRPPVDVSIKGDGGFDNLVVNLNMKAGAQPVVNGAIRLGKSDDGQTVSTNLSGPISILMPEEYRAFFGTNTALETHTTLKKDGSFRLDKLSITGAAIQVSAFAETASDGFLRRLNIDAHIASETGSVLVLPVKNGKTTVNKIALNVDYGAQNQQVWSGQLIVSDFANETFKAHDITLDMGGESLNLDDVAKRHVGIQISGGVNGITTNDPKIAKALGQAIQLNIDTDILAGQPTTVRNISISANGLSLWLKGEMAKFVFKGDVGVKADKLQSLAILSGTSISGAADLTAKGTIKLIGGALDLDLDGRTQNIHTGNNTVDQLMAGNITISGGIVRDASGFTARQFKLGNDKLALTANGNFSSVSADMDFALGLSDLGLLDTRLKGPISLRGKALGHNNLVALSVNAAIQNGTISGKKLQNTAISLNALLDKTSPIRSYMTGSLDGNGSFDGKPLRLSASLINNDDERALQGLNIEVGGAKINGDITQTIKGLLDGALHIDAPDISTLAALAMTQGHGAMHGNFLFNAQDGKQNAKLTANIQNLVVANIEVKSLDMNANIIDPMGQLNINGTLNVDHVKTPKILINSVNAQAKSSGNQTAFHVAAVLRDISNVELAGAFINADGAKKQLNINMLKLTQGTLKAQLANPAMIAYDTSDSSINIRNFNLNANGGSVLLEGDIAKALNLQLNINNLPLSLVDLVRPDLGASGTLTGKASVKGTKSAPNVAFAIEGHDLTVKALQEKNIAPLTLNANGSTNGDMLKINTTINGGGLDVGAVGDIPLTKGNFNLDVALNNLPVALANGFVKDQNLAGILTAHAHIGGVLTNPSVRFNIASQGLRAQVLANNGLTPISFDAKGGYDNAVVNLEALTLNGPKGLNFSASGRVPVLGNGIDLSIKGSAPLAIANQFVAERGAQVSGLATLDATIKGSFKQPILGGNFGVKNGSFMDSQINLRLNNINVAASLNGNTIVLNSLSANSSAGGSISANGSISTDFAAGMPADLTVHLNHTRYSDGEMVVATVNGAVTVTGALLHNPLIGGDITIEKAEITVPDKFGGASLIDVKHKHLTKPIQTTLKRAKIETDPKPVKVASTPASVPQLKVRVRAPNQIFVRGMGLDVELGGEIGLIGPVTDIRPMGGFKMIRGRFNILSQRLDFSEGQVTLVGNLNPEVNFVATSTGSDITVTVTVSGNVSNLNIVFSSQPALPQDEVLARLIFNRSISELSPFQIAQLASAAAELSGLTHTSLLGALRANTGLDDIDIVTDAKGNTGVRAGRYIRDNIYLGVEAGSGGDTKGTINLDISKSLKAKGALGAEGDSSVGVFYEKDY